MGAVFGLFLNFLVVWAALSAPSKAGAEIDLDAAASHFGLKPGVWGMRLSPNGQKVVFLKQHPQDFPITIVVDLQTGKSNLAVASDPKQGMDLRRCGWANDTPIPGDQRVYMDRVDTGLLRHLSAHEHSFVSFLERERAGDSKGSTEEMEAVLHAELSAGLIGPDEPVGW